jgi:hypothetical protein
VQWLSNGVSDYLISIGGEDKCVFQWKNCNGDEDNQKGKKGKIAAEESVSEPMDSAAAEDSGFEAPSGGDEFTAVKPWLGAIKQPVAWDSPHDPSKSNPYFAALGEFSSLHSALSKRKNDETVSYDKIKKAAESCLAKMHESGYDSSAAPDTDELVLSWVYGYRGADCRNNVFYVDISGKRIVVYYAAALGIVMDPDERTQKYFRGHTDDIMSMAVYQSADHSTALVASGQQAAATTFVWEIPSMKTLASVQTKQKSINQIAFSRY